MKRICSLIALSLAFISGAAAQNVPVTSLGPSDYIIVLHRGGMARPRVNYGTIFCLTTKGLDCDTMHARTFMPKSIADLTLNVHLSQAAFDKVKDMPSSIPPGMYDKPEGSFGKQWIDGGTSYVIASINGHKYNWRFTGPPGEFGPEMQKLVHYVYSCF